MLGALLGYAAASGKLAALLPADKDDAIQTTAAPGSPGATTTVSGKQLPPLQRSVPLALLLGVEQAAPETRFVARVAGAALLALGVPCWPGRRRYGGPGPGERAA